MIGIIDYGAGNLLSVAHAFDHLGIPHRRCSAVGDLRGVERLILPGVGHFGAAGRHLRASGLDVAVTERARAGDPLLGICLGLQLLLDASDEPEGVDGLGLLPGRSVPLVARRVPHMAWNLVTAQQASPLLDQGDYYYFAHGYVAELGVESHCVARTKVDRVDFPAMIGQGNVWGVQFHPEKSGDAGLALLTAFARC